jgi:hypothetical protein
MKKYIKNKPIMKNIKLLLLLTFVSVSLAAQVQVPVIEIPKPSMPFAVPLPNTNPQNRRNNMPQSTLQRNNNLEQLEQYERDRRNAEREKEELDRILNENIVISYELPSFEDIPGTEYYRQAAEKLMTMLRGKTPLNLKDAVFTVENAYFEEQLDRVKYNKSIEDLIYLAQQKAAEDKYNWNNNIVKNVMFFRIMTDTLKIKLSLREKSIISYPMQYDFDDFWGKDDYTKMFVSKLLHTHSGQCHSLPLLYLILCEAVGVEAFLAYSPSHSYVKFKDKTGDWYNMELTNGRFTTDAFVAGSGFVTAEAIKSGMYMRPLSRLETIAACLADLAGGYIHKYGYDEFMNRCADSILKYDEKNWRALSIKSDYKTLCVLHAVRQIGGQPTVDIVKKHYPRLYEMIEESKNLYRKIDEMGYRNMPEEIYTEWLNAVNKEKERREEHEQKYGKILQFIN